MAFTPQARKATKHQVKLKIGIQGPSGSGKTDGALALAINLVPGGKVLVVDTENESASLYADRYEFDTIPLGPPFLSQSYMDCIDYAVKNGYDVLNLDSITHEWDGDGGILRRKEAADCKPGSNQWTNWKPFQEEHARFREKIIQAPIHIICTMRSKTEYVLTKNNSGKNVPEKVGSAPIQKPEMEYEFSLVFDVQMDHRADVTKDRTGGIFGEKRVDLRLPETAEELRTWMNSGTVAPAPAAQPATGSQANAPSPAPATVIPSDFHYENGLMECCIVDVKHFPERTVKGATKKESVALLVNSPDPKHEKLSCFHKSLMPCLISAQKGERITLVVKENGQYLNVEDVRYIGAQAYEKGQPLVEEKKPIGGDDLPEFDTPKQQTLVAIPGIDNEDDPEIPF